MAIQSCSLSPSSGSLVHQIPTVLQSEIKEAAATQEEEKKRYYQTFRQNANLWDIEQIIIRYICPAPKQHLTLKDIRELRGLVTEPNNELLESRDKRYDMIIDALQTLMTVREWFGNFTVGIENKPLSSYIQELKRFFLGALFLEATTVCNNTLDTTGTALAKANWERFRKIIVQPLFQDFINEYFYAEFHGMTDFIKSIERPLLFAIKLNDLMAIQEFLAVGACIKCPVYFWIWDHSDTRPIITWTHLEIQTSLAKFIFPLVNMLKAF